MSGPRYALYYAPRDGEPLAAVARRWFASAPAEIVAEPRRYGFHGTLKAPIVLAEGATERDFLEAAGQLAASLGAITVPSIVLAEIGRFLALVPAERSTELQELADRCVAKLDGFRRPAEEAELARRRAAGLSARQDELLERWGYPYVLEEWRFHLTLTGSIADAAERGAVLAKLRQVFAGCLDQPLPVRDLCVFRQPTPDRPFAELARFRLGGGRLVRTEVWRGS